MVEVKIKSANPSRVFHLFGLNLQDYWIPLHLDAAQLEHLKAAVARGEVLVDGAIPDAPAPAPKAEPIKAKVELSPALAPVKAEKVDKG